MPVSTIARQFGPGAGWWAPSAPAASLRAGRVSEAVNSLLDHRDYKEALELSSYAYAKDTSWPRAAEHWLALTRLVLARALSTPRLRAA